MIGRLGQLGRLGQFGIVSNARQSKVADDEKVELFNPGSNTLLENAQLWVPDFENEFLGYFRKHPEKLYELPPRKFEELIALIFKNQGFNVELTPETGDGGFDVVAVQNDQLTGKSTYLVECKRYQADNKVGVGIIRSLYGVVTDQKATKGILATSSFFTTGAKKFEETNCNKLSLSDYDVVVGWLSDLNRR
jgi:restriction system protein